MAAESFVDCGTTSESSHGSNVLTTIGKDLTSFSDALKCDDLQKVGKHLAGFGDVLQKLAGASEKRLTVRRKAYDAVFRVKNSLQDILDESMISRHTHKECKDILKCLNESIQFEQMEIGEFLEKEKLSSYGELFSGVQIEFAGELLNAFDDVLKIAKSDMKRGSFTRFQKSIQRAKISRDYIERNLGTDLINLEKTFNDATNKIGVKLQHFIEDLKPVIDELLTVIQDEKKRILIITCVTSLVVALSGLSLVGAGAGCLVPVLIQYFSSGTLVCAAGVTKAVVGGVVHFLGAGVVGAVGGVLIYKKRNEMIKDLKELESTGAMVLEWQKALDDQFIQLRSIMTAFRELFLELKSHHKRYMGQQKVICEMFDQTDSILDEALSQTIEFERMVKDLRDREVAEVMT